MCWDRQPCLPESPGKAFLQPEGNLIPLGSNPRAIPPSRGRVGQDICYQTSTRWVSGISQHWQTAGGPFNPAAESRFSNERLCRQAQEQGAGAELALISKGLKAGWVSSSPPATSAQPAGGAEEQGEQGAWLQAGLGCARLHMDMLA